MGLTPSQFGYIAPGRAAKGEDRCGLLEQLCCTVVTTQPHFVLNAGYILFRTSGHTGQLVPLYAKLLESQRVSLVCTRALAPLLHGELCRQG